MTSTQQYQRCHRPILPYKHPNDSLCISCRQRELEQNAWPEICSLLASLDLWNHDEEGPLPLDIPCPNIITVPSQGSLDTQIVTRIKQERKAWRTKLESQRQYEKTVPRSALFKEFAGFVVYAVTQRDFYQRYMLSYYGYDVTQDRYLYGAQQPSPDDQYNTLLGAVQTYWFYASILWAGMRAFVYARPTGMDLCSTVALAVNWMRSAAKEIPPQLIAVQMDSRFDDVREQGIFQFVGWAATQISSKHASLTKALAEDGKSPFEVMLERLAGPSLEAWDDHTLGEPLKMLVNRIADALRREGPLAPSAGEKRATESWQLRMLGQEQPALEDWQVHQEAHQQVHALLQSAKLSPRELDAVILKYLKGYTVKQIAAEWKISAETVKDYLDQARKKLQLAS